MENQTIDNQVIDKQDNDNTNNEEISKLLKKRKRDFIINLSITLVSIVGVLAMMVSSSFLDNVLEGTKRIVFYGIMILGLLFWLAFVLIDRLVKLDEKEALYLAVAGTKKEDIFYKKYPNPNDDPNYNESLVGAKLKYKQSKKVLLFNIFSNVGDIYSVICVAFLIVAILFCFILFPATVVGECMEPLLYPESFSRKADKILALKNSKFEVGDVVVFSYDQSIQIGSSSIEDGELLIKRVIAGPGDKFECINGEIYVNDQLIDESYVAYPYSQYVGYNVSTIINNNTNRNDIDYQGDNIVPEGYYILLGDNRVVANDSHYFGLVSEDQICGVVKFYKNDEGWHKIN